MKIKAYIGRLKKKGMSNTRVLMALHKISPFTMWQGICIADYLDKKYPELRLIPSFYNNEEHPINKGLMEK